MTLAQRLAPYTLRTVVVEVRLDPAALKWINGIRK